MPMLPRVIDNHYRGHRLALWLLGVVLFLCTVISLRAIFAGYSVATSADSLPLGSYPADAVNTILTITALLGVSHLMVVIVGVLVLLRYRNLVPFMFALLLLEFAGRRVVFLLLPIARSGHSPAFFINLIFLALLLSGLALSLRRRPDAVQAELAASS